MWNMEKFKHTGRYNKMFILWGKLRFWWLPLKKGKVDGVNRRNFWSWDNFGIQFQGWLALYTYRDVNSPLNLQYSSLNDQVTFQ